MNPILPTASSGADGALTRGGALLYGTLLISVPFFLFLGYARLCAVLQFAYNCFLKPLGHHSSQQGRLDAFYKGQAAVYDSTRGGLLHGRKTMLRLCAAELSKRSNNGGVKPIWIDLGGGTGWNIEQMDLLYGISNFECVYLVDLCQPLCKVAERRFQDKGWTNVKVICQDALSFVLPELAGQDRGQIDLVTMSYSLSMIENFYPVVDRITSLLNPQTGFIGVADFYVSGTAGPSGRRDAEKAGVLGYQCSWFTRVFWQHWFEFDHVYLHPCRRNYLELKFATHKVLNCRNHFIIPYLIQIPYYVWLGRPGDSVESKPYQHSRPVITNSVYAITSVSPPSSPDLPPVISSDHATPTHLPKHMQRGRSTFSVKSNVNLGPPVLSTPISSNTLATSHSGGWSRLPYQPTKPEHAQFSTYIYGFTWEDPQRDLEVLDLRSGDNLMVITSAGDNALAYAAHQSGLTIHCVDMNPCQNHLLELKLAALRSLDYDTFWRMFGLGSLPDFGRTLDSTLSAELSSPAYQYWRRNVHAFAPRQNMLADSVLGDLNHRNLYTTGYSGVALRYLRVISKMFAIHRATQQLVIASSLAKQAKIWQDKIRGRLFSNIAIRILDNPVAMWQFMGVPINQWNMLRSEGSMSQYVRDTLDPVFHSSSCATSNYFYRLLFARQYSPDCCPDYLTKDGFARLQLVVGTGAVPVQPTFHLHTATLLDTLNGMRDGELTKAVIMDHMDWFSPEDAESEVVALARVVRKTGFVLWRSAARIPWYIAVFKRHGFTVEALDIRKPNSMTPLDRVNMYASLYKATKL